MQPFRLALLGFVFAFAVAAVDDDFEIKVPELATYPAPSFLVHRRFLKLVQCLTFTGMYDGAWIDMFDLDFEELRFRNLLDQLPQDLIEFISKTTYSSTQAYVTEPVETVRNAYPPPLRKVFPRCHLIAGHILTCYKNKDVLKRPEVLRALRHYGILFVREHYELFVQKVAGKGLDHLLYDKIEGPSLLITEMLDEGREKELPELFAIDEFAALVLKEKADCIPNLSSSPGFAQEMVRFQRSFATAIISDSCWFSRRDVALLMGVPASKFILKNIIFRKALAFQGLKPDVTFDVTPRLYTDIKINFGKKSRQKELLRAVRHFSADSFLELLYSEQKKKFSAVLTEELLPHLVHMLGEKLSAPGGVEFVRHVLEDPDWKDRLTVAVNSEGWTLMHDIIRRREYGLMNELLRSEKAQFKHLDKRGYSAICYISLEDILAFIEHLPEPKAEHLSRFYLLDLLAQIFNGIAKWPNSAMPALFVVMSSLCDLMPEIIDVSVEGFTLRFMMNTKIEKMLIELGQPAKRIRKTFNLARPDWKLLIQVFRKLRIPVDDQYPFTGKFKTNSPLLSRVPEKWPNTLEFEPLKRRPAPSVPTEAEKKLSPSKIASVHISAGNLVKVDPSRPPAFAFVHVLSPDAAKIDPNELVTLPLFGEKVIWFAVSAVPLADLNPDDPVRVEPTSEQLWSCVELPLKTGLEVASKSPQLFVRVLNRSDIGGSDPCTSGGIVVHLSDPRNELPELPLQIRLRDLRESDPSVPSKYSFAQFTFGNTDYFVMMPKLCALLLGYPLQYPGMKSCPCH